MVHLTFKTYFKWSIWILFVKVLVVLCPKYILNTLFYSYLLNKIHCKLMREVFLLMQYNLTTLKIYFKRGRKFKFFCHTGLKFVSFSLSNQKRVGKITWLSEKIHIYEMLQEVKLKAKKQHGSLFAKENDALSRHEK